MALLTLRNTSKLSDTELIVSYRKSGKSRFFNEIFNRYYHLVYGVCLNYLKNETDSQDAVLAIFEKLSLDLKETEVTYFKTWLYSVAKNFCLMQIRSQQRKQKHVDRYVDEMKSDSNLDYHEEEKQVKETKIEELTLAIEQLKDEQKQCIQLFYLEQKCYQEVAEIMKTDIKKVKSCIQNGKRNLRLLLTQPEKMRTA